MALPPIRRTRPEDRNASIEKLISPDQNLVTQEASDAFRNALDALRRSLPVIRTRSRLIDFRTFAKSRPAQRKVGGTEWTIVVGPKRLMYDIRKASADGTLILYSHFVRYNAKGWVGSLRAPLFTTHVSFDATSATARPTGARRLNTQLVDVLKALGVDVDTSGDEPTLAGLADIASLDGDDRVAAAPPTPLQPSAYLDYEANPALLDNPLLRLFVEGSASETCVSAVSRERPRGPDHAGRTSDSLPVSEGDENEPSERRPQAVQGSANHAVPLDMDQKAAVDLAMSVNACLIDGPPGTGKSQVIAALAHLATIEGLRMIVTSSEDSAIAVAKRRTAGSASIEAMTIEQIAATPPPTIGIPDFDILVIDEASRMTLAYAATAISRSRSVVIIGDDRQMRPETGEETVLDRAQSLDLPSVTLRFHYRSKERSLITPSNSLSYGMKLRTVPTPDLDGTNGLKVAFLSGTMTQGSLGAENRSEATVVMDMLQKYAAKENSRSIGVITSNHAQRELIKREIARVLSTNQINRLSPMESEPLLIASATECQGEERDVIIVSMVYDTASKRLGNFEKNSAIRLLNVMLSRARQEMTIITSYRPSSENDSRRQIPSTTILDALFFIIDAATTTETRQEPLPAFVSLAQKLNVLIDHLGVVIGLRRPTDRSYRVGIIPITDQKTEEDWTMIERQLEAVGWRTVRLTELECRMAPSEAIAKIKARMGE